MNKDGKFDTMAYIIHCSNHDTIAVYNNQWSGINWLPFTLQSDDKYENLFPQITLLLNVQIGQQAGRGLSPPS